MRGMIAQGRMRATARNVASRPGLVSRGKISAAGEVMQPFLRALGFGERFYAAKPLAVHVVVVARETGAEESALASRILPEHQVRDVVAAPLVPRAVILEAAAVELPHVP